MQTLIPAIEKGDDGTAAIAHEQERDPADGARFLQVQTLGSIVGNSLAIYTGNWRTISLIYITAMLPIALLHTLLLGAERGGLAQIVGLIFSLMGMLIGAVVTVVISDLCLGVKPRAGRSYRRAFLNIGRLIGTFLLLALLMGGAIVALALAVFIPWYLSHSIVTAAVSVFAAIFVVLVASVTIAAWFMFTLPVVVLEQLGGMAALKRSRALGKGSYSRNIGVVALIAFPAAIVTWVLAYALASIIAPIFGAVSADLMQGMAEILQILVASPLLSIPGILVYYDMRARKDGYGAVQLAEELQT